MCCRPSSVSHGLILFLIGALSGCGQQPPAKTSPSPTSPVPSVVDATPAASEVAAAPPAAVAPQPVETEPAQSQPGETPPPMKLTVPAEPTPAAAETAPAVTLGIGDPAPPLALAKFVTGESVTGIEPGRVHVVEFWATWCGPCLASMPHISQLQTEYGDKVRFIGVTREGADVVEKFLDREQSEGKTWRDVITYRLVLDDDSQTNTAYMKAAGQSGIPCAFIVGTDGAVEWIGHPMSIDESLAKIVAGDWDRTAAIAEYQDRQRQRAAQARLSSLLRANKTDEALAVLDEMAKQSPSSAALTRMRWIILQRAERSAEADAALAQLIEQSWEDAERLNDIAWTIAAETPADKPRNLALALKAAQRGCELRDNNDTALMDTLARVHYELGDLTQALDWQRKAASKADANDEVKAALLRYETEHAAQVAAPPAAETSPAAPAPTESAAP